MVASELSLAALWTGYLRAHHTNPIQAHRHPSFIRAAHPVRALAAVRTAQNTHACWGWCSEYSQASLPDPINQRPCSAARRTSKISNIACTDRKLSSGTAFVMQPTAAGHRSIEDSLWTVGHTCLCRVSVRSDTTSGTEQNSHLLTMSQSSKNSSGYDNGIEHIGQLVKVRFVCASTRCRRSACYLPIA